MQIFWDKDLVTCLYGGFADNLQNSVKMRK